MADLDYVYVVGRFGIAVADGGDPDDDPDTVWCDTGTISLEPQKGETKVAGGLPVPWTGGQSVFKPTIDAEGFLTWHGQHFMKVVDLTSDKVNPRVVDGKATHGVRFDQVKAGDQTVTFEQRPVRLSADMATALDSTAAAAYGLPTGTLVCDLTKLLPVPVANSVPIVVGPQGPPGDPTLTDEVTATNISTGDLTKSALATEISTTGTPAEMAVTAKIAALKQWAKNPDQLVAGAVSYTSGLLSSAVVEWPDGAPGVLTITARQGGTDAVTNYAVTHVADGTTLTYTQPTITRDSSGLATLVPQITVA